MWKNLKRQDINNKKLENNGYTKKWFETDAKFNSKEYLEFEEKELRAGIKGLF